MEVLAWVLVGIIVGIIAKLMLKDYADVSWFLAVMLGITGAVVGGFVSATIGLATNDVWEFVSIGTTIAGAVGVLLIHQIFEKY